MNFFLDHRKYNSLRNGKKNKRAKIECEVEKYGIESTKKQVDSN